MPALEAEFADYTAQLDREYMTLVTPIALSQEYGYAMALADSVVERFLPTPIQALDWAEVNDWLADKTPITAGLQLIERITSNVESFWLCRLQLKWMGRFNGSFVVRFDIDEQEGDLVIGGMIPQQFARHYLPE